VEAAGGILLVVAAVVALVWANSPWSAAYETLWHTNVTVSVGSYTFVEDLGHLVNDLLMALFFFVAGMEIKRELVVGDLRDPRKRAVPALAALGGMLVPAGLYALVNRGGAGSDGWGIPMATDIAFALGVFALLGRWVPGPVKVLLLTLAIVDDLGAIIVIAAFYSDNVRIGQLVIGAAIIAAVVVLHRLDVTYLPIYVAAAIALWLLVYESGVHATIAGVAMGLATPALPRQTDLEAEEVVDVLEHIDDITPADVRTTAAAIRGSISACDRMIDSLHPWTSYLIIPLFALANAGIELSADTFTSPSAVFVGVIVGLVVGKLIGVTAFSWLAVRAGLGRLPDGVRWAHIVGIAAVAGIGFTMSIFVTGLAFEDDLTLQADAKAGVFVASLLAAGIGAVVMSTTSRRETSGAPPRDVG
jgi:NhaA family Na+:H+ antiporter